MKEKLQSFVYKVLAVITLIGIVFIACAMLAGPLMIGWNWSLGLFLTPVSYIKCLKIILGTISAIAILSIIFRR